MRLGAENSKKTIAASALFLVAIFLFIRMLTGSSSRSAPQANAAAPAAPVHVAKGKRVPARKGSHGTADKSAGPVTPNLDPRLHLADLQQTEDTTYDGTGRNIFTETQEPVIPKALGNGFTKEAQKVTPPPVVNQGPPPPPPINLKFFGFASGPDHKRIFLSQGDEVFVAGEGDIVQRRYKIMKINNNNIEVLDVLSNNRQTIPLTAG